MPMPKPNPNPNPKPTTPVRARITETLGGVTLDYTDEWGDRRVRVFIGQPGRYIRESDERGGTRQVCSGLAATGKTLIWWREGHGTRADQIRQEYRRMRRAARGVAS